MSAEVLRRAAALMRERAKPAASSTGASDWFVGSPTSDNRFATVRSSGGQVARGMTDDEAEHIASWHPVVALAVADWLDETAGDWAKGPCDAVGHACNHCEYHPADLAALAVARAYLGEQP